MKKSISFLLAAIVFCAVASAQNFPYGINYQGVARDANGNAKQYPGGVPLRFTITKTTSGGTIVWQETQTSPPTNIMGQFNVTIGTGVRQPASTVLNFSDIDWIADKHFLNVEIQTGISTFMSIGIQQLMSVPYAMATPNDVPVGTVVAYFGTTAPPGWLMCDGTAVGRSGYAKLFTVIGISCGQGDGSTTFNLPDLRGMFLRGVDGIAGNDPDKASRTAQNTGGNTGNNVGSKQADDLKAHTHSMPGGDDITSNPHNNIFKGAVTNLFSGTTGSTGGSETRPKNVYVNYIIKY